MKARCGPNSHKPEYVNVYYDPRWEEFEYFYLDMGERPDGHTLERNDGSRGYYKDNCRWATPYEQTKNRSCTALYTYKGSEYTLTELAALSGNKPGTIRARIHRDNWTVEDAVDRPPHG